MMAVVPGDEDGILHDAGARKIFIILTRKRDAKIAAKCKITNI
jgi:hypothetical protein